MRSEVRSPAVLISTCGLSLRSNRACKRMGLVTLGDLTRVSADDLLVNKCFGTISLHEVRALLAEFGLALKGDPKPDRRPGGTETGVPQATPLMWFEAFAHDPRHHLGLPLWVLDLCPRTLAWLTGRQLGTVLELVDCSRDDLWLLALAADLSLVDTLLFIDDIEVRLRAFQLWLRPARPSSEVFRLPSGTRDEVAGYPLDEYRLRAETIFRLRRARVKTLGDLECRAAELDADLATWPHEPADEARALLALLKPASCRPSCDEPVAVAVLSETSIT
jgi:hypothetical protein